MCEPRAVVLKAHPESIKKARDFVVDAISPWGIDPDVAALVISELATNAIVHAEGDTIIVRAARNVDASVSLETWDKDPRRGPAVRRADLDDTAGRGLFLVESLVRSWGVRPLADDAGKVVFAILDPD
ncbi:ATP-binding protein [Actinomadura macrotermitis]|uniref:Histidine kinase/HSP90-like ATPase domain-containing protein n=1 Tax=Actinomadura macrotermitis TaxID=2585200 RepID=A0A7K0BN83_9ACTN|nr:ATP-binding protein [Actinomadura macrotermitis]MQY02631.1 hypothetical protein [Actinomadura macrotermitis]